MFCSVMPKNIWDEDSLSMHPQPFNKGKLQPEKPFMMIPLPPGAPFSQTSVGHTNHNFSWPGPVFIGRELSIVIDWYRLGHI